MPRGQVARRYSTPDAPYGGYVNAAVKAGQFAYKHKSAFQHLYETVKGSYTLPNKEIPMIKVPGSKQATSKAITAGHGLGLERRVAAKRTINKSARNRKRPKVTVSRQFRNKVTTALEKKQVHGKLLVQYYSNGMFAGVADNLQQCWDGFDSEAYSGSRGSPANAPPSPYSFTPEFFVHAASMLFNAKTRDNYARANMVINNAGNLSPETIKFTIRNSYTQYTIRNGQNRRVSVQIYLCKPKKASSYNFGYTMNGDASATANSTDFSTCSVLTTHVPMVNGSTQETRTWGTTAIADALPPPSIAWTQALTSEQLQGLNFDNTTQQEPSLNPMACAAFRKLFDVEKLDILLEPGQIYDFSIQGPSNFEFKMNKHFQQGIFRNAQTYMVCPLVVVNPDLVHSTEADPITDWIGRRRYDNGTGTRKPILLFERKDYVSITMPEQTGFQYAAADEFGSVQELQLRRNAWLMDTQFAWSAAPATELLSTVMQNAQTTETV